jgi:phytoene synthase
VTERGRTIVGDGSLYDKVAVEAAAVVIRRYSTSFGLATRLLSSSIREDITNFYALVRLADEIVDGVAASAEFSSVEINECLTAFEIETNHALDTGFSTNLVIHAFGLSARKTGVGRDLTEPFFDSMRMDITQTVHTPESFNNYVYGSAEVVGLMCLQAFLYGETRTVEERRRLVDGARHLGAAFQKINFLRDLAADFGTLGRSYFPGITVESFSEAEKIRLLDDIDADLAVSAATLPLLPAGPRKAVALAHGLFAELNHRLRTTPAAVIATTRIRVPNPVKLRIAAGVVAGRLPKEHS